MAHIHDDDAEIETLVAYQAIYLLDGGLVFVSPGSGPEGRVSAESTAAKFRDVRPAWTIVVSEAPTNVIDMRDGGAGGGDERG